MPTGYTAIVEERDVTFEEFALRCARAFGALVDMKEDRLDAPIPDEIPVDAYCVKRALDAKERLSVAMRMTLEEAQAALVEAQKKEDAYRQEEIAKRQLLRSRYNALLEQARAWVPPSPEHVRMKSFMVEQIETSMSDCDTSYLESPPKVASLTPVEYAQFMLDKAREDLRYARDELLKAQERARERNVWLHQLRESLRPVNA